MNQNRKAGYYVVGFDYDQIRVIAYYDDTDGLFYTETGHGSKPEEFDYINEHCIDVYHLDTLLCNNNQNQ